MENTTTGTTENQGNQVPVDPWAAAFAALDQAGKEDPEAAAGSTGGSDDGSSTDSGSADGEGSDNLAGSDSSSDEGNAGGLDSVVRGDTEEANNAFGGFTGVTEESIQQYENESNERIRNRAIEEIAQEFVSRGIRNNNGMLGATLDDPDICKRDEDGVPRFYNPETGREFTGDNPRRQAQEWVQQRHRNGKFYGAGISGNSRRHPSRSNGQRDSCQRQSRASSSRNSRKQKNISRCSQEKA